MTWLIRGQQALLLLLSGCALSACASSGMTFGDVTVDEAFPNPEVAALVKAGVRGQTERMEALVKQGADINYRGKDGVTPLIWVLAARSYEGGKKLLELGADPNQKMASAPQRRKGMQCPVHCPREPIW